MVWEAASPSSGNQLSSSSLSLILSLEQTRLKPSCFICVSIISSLSSTAHGFIPTRINWALACALLTPSTFGNYPNIRRQFVSRSSRPLLLRFIASLVFLRLFEPVRSRVLFASLTDFVCSCVPLIVSIALRIYCVSHLFREFFIS
jgi:hypothetical protein